MRAADVVARARAALGAGWIYDWGGTPNPQIVLPGAQYVRSDCSGFVWWTTDRVRAGWVDSPAFGPEIGYPVAGCAVRYDGTNGASGHAGVVVKVYSDGDFDTIDCSSSNPTGRGGAVRFIPRARTFWKNKGSTFRWPANVEGEPSASVAQSGMSGWFLVAIAGGFWWRRRRTA